MLNDEQIYQKILKAIVEHQLPPGTRLPEDKLSETFGRSRTSIRKVLQRLAIERVVEIKPNKGAQVNSPSEQEAEEVFTSRMLIEPLLIPEIIAKWDTNNTQNFRHMVAEEHRAEKEDDLAKSIQLTAKFHYQLAQCAGNSVMAEFIGQLCNRSSLVIAAYGSNKSVSCDCGDHGELLDLIEQHNEQQAIDWMKHHLLTIKSSLTLKSKTTQPINFHKLFSE
jgi:DNA-binding GntR family transcriptional regulator